MRSLKQRLQALRGPRQAGGADTGSADLVQRIERLRAGRGGAAPSPSVIDDTALARRLDAERIGEGLLLLQRGLEPDHRHGVFTVRPPVRGLYTDTDDWLLLDTETTGLAGGSGTLAFLVGVAGFRDGRLWLRQYLMTRFAAEAQMLQRLCGDLHGRETLVSYNGKSYDLPLLADRLRLHGLDNPFRERPHLDLLHAVRRRHAGDWENCRLATAERELLGLKRQHDLPGSQAPAAWLDYVRSGRGDSLERVVAHNRDDLISLAVLPEALESGGVATRPSVPPVKVPATKTRERLRALRSALAAG